MGSTRTMKDITKYAKTRHNILNYIASRNIKEGDRLPTERELCRILDVSIITVRRALQDLYERNIIDRIQGRGTFLQSDFSRSKLLGEVVMVIVAKTEHGRGIEILDLSSELMKRRYGLKVLCADSRPDNKIVEAMSQSAGVFLSGKIDEGWISFMRSMGLPFVLLGSNDLKLKHCAVKRDWEKAARLMVRHLSSCGHRRIGLLNGAKRYYPALKINEGYCREMAKQNLPVQDSWVSWVANDEYFDRIMEFFARNKTDFDALILEAGCYTPLLSLYYNGQLKGEKPFLGIISGMPVLYRQIPGVAEASFGKTIYEDAVETLFSIMGDKIKRDKIINIEPKLFI